ncbi:hypothetical protein [Microbulbifer sp. MCCC 1A16149]|uniref:hypothetical protein n=1 Tax=Microbulbifer sp. MCCC 1A16149 TaxID=3411322 RepID=UPI003D0BF80A
MKRKSERKISIKISAKEQRAPGNPVAQNPLLRKGGAHVRAKSADRFDSKQQTRKAAREWDSSRSCSF